MNDLENIVNTEGLPLRYVYQYLVQKGFENEANEIKQSKDRYKSYTSTLRRGKIIELLEKNNLQMIFNIKLHIVSYLLIRYYKIYILGV